MRVILSINGRLTYTPETKEAENMKKNFKGFTLIECLIALAILGIASLTMAQIYAGVSKRNRNNQIMNTSLSNQMSYVERYTASEAVPIYYGSTSNTPDTEAKQASTTKKPPHEKSVTTNYNYVQLKKVVSGKDPLEDTLTTADYIADSTYSFPVDVYVLLSRDNKDRDSTDSNLSGQYDEFFENSDSTKTYEDDYNLRYRYLLGHTN